MSKINKILFLKSEEHKALQKWQTTLTSWFDLNVSNEFAKSLKYVQIPQYLNYSNKKWVRKGKTRNFGVIGRLAGVSPKDSERFHLKVILNHVKGAT